MAVAGAVAIPLALGTLRRNTGFDFAMAGGATIIASDVGTGPSLLLRDDELGLCGKPDYLLDTRGADGRRLVPIEVKPNRRSPRLYDSDRMQIGAYLVALKATADDRASKIGYVRYQTDTFEVELTPTLEREIRLLVATIRRARVAEMVHRTHESPARCRACPVRQHCDEALSG
jgi:CRISPR-associated protein Cas4